MNLQRQPNGSRVIKNYMLIKRISGCARCGGDHDDIEANKVSPRGSWKGYNFFTALKRNKDAVKLFLGIIGAINIIPPFDWKTCLVTIAAGLLALVVKIIMDALDFFTSDVKI